MLSLEKLEERLCRELYCTAIAESYVFSVVSLLQSD